MSPRRAAIALLVALGALLGFAPVAALAAHLAPLVPSSEMAGPTAADRAAPRAVVRELPVGLPGGALPRNPGELDQMARLALGSAGAQHLDRLLGADRNLPAEDPLLTVKAYPGHYAEVDRLLDAAQSGASTRAAGQLGASLVVLASERLPDADGSAAHPSAAAVAYALLLRSRHVVGCDAEVDLLLLLASDNQPHDGVVSEQGRVAGGACPADPTPGWILTEYLARRARLATVPDLPEAEKDIDPDAFAHARDAAAGLVAAYPGSPDVRTAVGDVHLAAGRELGASQPFTGRGELASALAAYQAAAALGGDRAALAGQTQALLGLGRPADALAVLSRLQDPPGPALPGPGQQLLLEAEEAAHDFSAAASTAGTMARAGRAAFPASGPLFPHGQSSSLRFDTSVSLDVDLAPCCGGAGGGDLLDVSFIPTYRAAAGLIAEVSAVCPGFVERRDQLLAGRSEQALQGFPDRFDSVRPDEATACDLLETTLLQQVLGADAGRPLPSDPEERDKVLDGRQNLLRWGGDLDRASTAALEWDQVTGRSRYLPVERLGEIRYLQGRDDEAAALFGEALRRAQNGYQINLDQARARLDRAAALLAGGRAAEGTAELRLLAADLDWIEASFRLGAGTSADPGVADQYAVLAYYARLQLGDAERIADAPAAAVEDYDAARARLPLRDPSDDDVRQVFPGVLLNDEALALMAVGRSQEARSEALLAVAEDPGSPVFSLTAGSAAQQLEDAGAAERDNAVALALDPTTFPAATNLGVALARDGQVRGAATAFRRAVGARPDYATGWFDLGVTESRRGPLHLLQAQGSLARAFALDPTLRDHARTLVLDEHVYRTGLDVSKPLPPSWSFQRVSRRQPVAALGLVAAFGLVVASSSAAGSQTSQLRQWIEASATTLSRPSLLRHRRHVAWAAAATVLTFGVATAWSRPAGATALVAYLVGVSLLVAVVLLARQVVGGHLRVRLVQRTWPPALLLGVATGAFGVPWAPLPYVRGPARAGRVHLAAPVCLAGLAALLLLEWAVWSTPLTQSLAVAAAVMTASLLLPLGPLDGGAIARRGQLLVGLGAAAGLLLLVLGLG